MQLCMLRKCKRINKADRNVEIEIKAGEVLQLDLQDLGIPAGLLGELVVGKDVGAFLRVIEMLEPDARHGLVTEQLGSFDAAVAGDDAAVLVDQHGVVEPERLDARRDLSDLLRTVRPGIAVIRLQTAGRQVCNFELRHQ